MGGDAAGVPTGGRGVGAGALSGRALGVQGRHAGLDRFLSGPAGCGTRRWHPRCLLVGRGGPGYLRQRRGWKIWSSVDAGSGPTFQFGTKPTPVPYWATDYPGNKSAQQMYQSRVMYAGSSGGITRVVSPWATVVRAYAKIFIFRGMLLGLVLLAGLVGLAWRWRRAGRRALLPWAVCAMLIVGPPATAGFSYRYVAAAVPLACVAVGPPLQVVLSGQVFAVQREALDL
jgi:hypothetical protein